MEENKANTEVNEVKKMTAIEEAQALIEAEKKERCDLAAKKLEEISNQLNVTFVPCVTIDGKIIDLFQLLNAEIGLRIVSN